MPSKTLEFRTFEEYLRHYAPKQYEENLIREGDIEKYSRYVVSKIVDRWKKDLNCLILP